MKISKQQLNTLCSCPKLLNRFLKQIPNQQSRRLAAKPEMGPRISDFGSGDGGSNPPGTIYLMNEVQFPFDINVFFKKCVQSKQFPRNDFEKQAILLTLLKEFKDKRVYTEEEVGSNNIFEIRLPFDENSSTTDTCNAIHIKARTVL